MYAHQSISSVHRLGSELFDQPSYYDESNMTEDPQLEQKWQVQGTTTTNVLWPFVRNDPDEPVPEETFTD